MLLKTVNFYLSANQYVNFATVNLIIDIGNSYTKIAVFKNDELLHHILKAGFDERDVTFFFRKYAIRRAIVSSVSQPADEIRDIFSEMLPTQPIMLDTKTSIPLKIQYSTPETLGSDRLANAIGGKYHYPDKSVLVIDAGTCITYDVVTHDRTYRGGAISPGLMMRYNAMHHYTRNLPQLSPTDNAVLTGDSTTSSIHSGVLNGIVEEMNGMITRFRKTYPDIEIVVTGGDVNYFDKKLKNTIFAGPNIVLTGLNQILKYNFDNNEKI